jgi:hypothetical protein
MKEQVGSSPRVTHLSWGRLGVEGGRIFKDAKLFYNELRERARVGGLFHTTC